jgi:hypothetical protein
MRDPQEFGDVEREWNSKDLYQYSTLIETNETALIHRLREILPAEKATAMICQNTMCHIDGPVGTP